MSNSHNHSAKEPTKEELADRNHKAFHFLDDWAQSPDADEWLRYHIMVALRILNGQSLKGTLIYMKETGEVKIIDKD